MVEAEAEAAMGGADCALSRGYIVAGATLVSVRIHTLLSRYCYVFHRPEDSANLSLAMRTSCTRTD